MGHRKNRHSNDSPLKKKTFLRRSSDKKKWTPKKWTEKKRTMNLENTNVSMASPQKQTRNKDSQQEEEKKNTRLANICDVTDIFVYYREIYRMMILQCTML